MALGVYLNCYVATSLGLRSERRGEREPFIVAKETLDFCFDGAIVKTAGPELGGLMTGPKEQATGPEGVPQLLHTTRNEVLRKGWPS